MKTRAGIWILKNGKEAKIFKGENGIYYSIADCPSVLEMHFYDQEGECYKSILLLEKIELSTKYEIGAEIYKRDVDQKTKDFFRRWDLDRPYLLEERDCEGDGAKVRSVKNSIMELEIGVE